MSVFKHNNDMIYVFKFSFWNHLDNGKNDETTNVSGHGHCAVIGARDLNILSVQGTP